MCVWPVLRCRTTTESESHPLVQFVEKAFPEGGRVWQAAERIVTTLDPDNQVRAVLCCQPLPGNAPTLVLT